MQSIFRMLKEDHRNLRDLLSSIQSPKAKSRRGWIFLDVQRELEIHALTEEQGLYPKLESKEEALGLVRQARQEHGLMRFYLDKLENLAVEDPAFLSTVAELKDLVERHLHEEETGVFNKMTETMSEDELVEMARDFREIKENLLAPPVAA